MDRATNDGSLRLAIAKHLWGWAPHETQRRWLASSAMVKVAACGRRWGKTESAAIDATTTAILHPGCAQMIVSPTYDQSRLIFSAIERLVMGSPITRPLAKIVRTPYPKLALCGSLITARTADEDGRNLRGHAADRVIVDEAAFVRDSVIHEVIAPMLADRNGQLVMISTPFGKNHFYRAFVRGQGPDPPPSPLPRREGEYALSSPAHEEDHQLPSPNRRGVGGEVDRRCESFSFPSWANPHISRDYIELQREELSPRQFSVEYEARFIDDQSSVFPWEEIEAAAQPREQMTGNREQSECVVVGIDWGRYADYTALIALGVSESCCEVVGLDAFNGMGWSSQIERAAQFIRAHEASAVLTDQTSIGDPLLEQLRARLWETGADASVEGYCFTNQSKRQLVDHIALKFSRREIAIPRDERLMKELQYFEYELTPSGNVRMNAHSGCHDDLVTALSLACWQAKGVGYRGSFLSRNGRMAAAGW